MLARSRAIDHRRATAAEPREREVAEGARLLASAEPGPEDQTAILERRALVTRACIDLAPNQRQVIELAYFRGFSHSEIAAELKQPLGTVKTRIRAGMMRLRETLEKSGAATW
jgi:RNA polymerase sigma-70 factor (ECF subfamily)